MEDEIELILKRYIPFMTGLSFVCGVSRTFFFYQYFEFNALPFLEFNEIISLTFRDFVVLFIGSCFYMILFKLMNTKRIVSRYKLAFEQENFWKSIKNDNLSVLFFLILICELIFEISRNIFQWKIAWLKSDLFLPIVITVLYLFIYEYCRSYYKKNNNTFPKAFFLSAVIFSGSAIIIGAAASLKKAYNYKDDNTYLNNAIVIDKTIIKSKNNYYYIGRCNNYIFFYNESNSTTDVYPADKIDKLTLNH